MYPFLIDASFCPCFCFVHTIAQFSRILRFSHIYCQIFRIRTNGWRKWHTTAFTSTIGSEKFKKFGNKCLKNVNFWRTELSYRQSKNRGRNTPEIHGIKLPDCEGQPVKEAKICMFADDTQLLKQTRTICWTILFNSFEIWKGIRL